MSSYSTEVLADSPSVYLRLDETAGTTAVSQVNSPSADGTYANGPVLNQPGLTTVGRSVLFPETTNPHITVPSGSWLDLGDTFTLELWVNPTTFAASQATKTLLGRNGGAYALVFTSTAIQLYQTPTATLVYTAPISPTVGSTYHVVVTKNGADAHVYLNGFEIPGTLTNQTFVNGTGNLTIANDAANISAYLDEIALYKTALSAGRVLAHYSAGTSAGTSHFLAALGAGA